MIAEPANVRTGIHRTPAPGYRTGCTMANAPSIGTQLVMRLETPNTPGSFGILASAIRDAGGMVAAVDTRTVGKPTIVPDATAEVGSKPVAPPAPAPLRRPPAHR